MTTIVSVRRNGHVVIAGDGQATLGNTVMKGNVKKVRRLYNDKVIAGFAGGTADAFTLFELFERKLEMHQGHLVKAAVELAKTGVPIACCANLKHCWQSRMKLHRLSSPVTVTWCSQKTILLLSAPAALTPRLRRALLENTELSAREIAEKALDIAGDICIYTNHFHTIEELSYKA